MLRDWEIRFFHPVERVIRFTDKVKHVIYTDASSVQGGSIGRRLIAVSKAAQARKIRYKGKYPKSLSYDN